MTDRLTKKAMQDMKKAEAKDFGRWKVRIKDDEIDPWIICFQSFYMPGQGIINYMFMRDEFQVVKPDGIEEHGLKGDVLVRKSPESYSVYTKPKFKKEFGNNYVAGL